jgi:hypothetical protein
VKCTHSALSDERRPKDCAPGPVEHVELDHLDDVLQGVEGLQHQQDAKRRRGRAVALQVVLPLECKRDRQHAGHDQRAAPDRHLRLPGDHAGEQRGHSRGRGKGHREAARAENAPEREAIYRCVRVAIGVHTNSPRSIKLEPPTQVHELHEF